MNSIREVFDSPEFYPMRIDFEKQVVRYVRMSRETYKSSVFLDSRTRHLGSGPYEVRMDDMLLAAGGPRRSAKPVHYILHTTFCCSTLLARYFELLPICFVLKEPGLLTQLSLAGSISAAHWHEAFDLSLLLLTRTYDPSQFVVIKPHEPVNSLGIKLLEHDPDTTVTFLSTPVRPFLLSVLKEPARRYWVRKRVLGAAQSTIEFPALGGIDVSSLSEPEAVAFLWILNRLLRNQLLSSKHGRRVLAIAGDDVARSPNQVLSSIAALSGIPLDDQDIRSMVNHPSVRQYSKDLSRPYDSQSRQRELSELEIRWGSEADLAIKWATSRGLDKHLEL
jgi:hypothetical protein